LEKYELTIVLHVIILSKVYNLVGMYIHKVNLQINISWAFQIKNLQKLPKTKHLISHFTRVVTLTSVPLSEQKTVIYFNTMVTSYTLSSLSIKFSRVGNFI